LSGSFGGKICKAFVFGEMKAGQICPVCATKKLKKSVVMQFELEYTPKALAKFSPAQKRRRRSPISAQRLELATTLGTQLEIRANAESVRQ